MNRIVMVVLLCIAFTGCNIGKTANGIEVKVDAAPAVEVLDAYVTWRAEMQIRVEDPDIEFPEFQLVAAKIKVVDGAINAVASDLLNITTTGITAIPITPALPPAKVLTAPALPGPPPVTSNTRPPTP